MSRLFVLVTVLLAFPLSGCEALSEAIVLQSDPTNTAPQTNRTTSLAIAFDQITAIRDCDGVEGDGDFKFWWKAEPSFASAYERHRSPRLGPGQSTGDLGGRMFTGPAVDGQQITVTFTASEMDKPVFGAERPDPQMNNQSKAVRHTFRNGRWSNLGNQRIELGSGGCHVRLSYNAQPA
jgi:hypothetical protein